MDHITVNTDNSLYDSLPDSQSIRVLCILPGTGLETVCCRLVVISLDKKPGYEFEALSYVWGDPEPVRYIECNDIAKKVTPNLLAALRRLRDSQKARWIWVDAICINQDDLEERSQQVQLMRRIYSEARGVVVYLGEDENNQASLALDILHKAYDRAIAATRYSYSLTEVEAQDFPPLVKDQPAWKALIV